MGRKKSVTTRIHQPPAPPCWFRTVFYLSFGAWVLLQAATEYYTSRSLHIYTHLTIFAKEKQVTAAFLSIMSVGILTICLALTFIYGICTVSKLIVLSSSSFLSTLLILNISSVSILMSSHFSLKIGPLVRSQRVLTIYHKNVSKENWQREIQAWKMQYPLSELSSTTGGPMATGAAPADTATASSPAGGTSLAGGGSGRAADGVTPASAGSNGTGLTAAPDSAAAASSSGTGSPPPAGLPPEDRRQRSAWVESRALYLLRFFQHNAFCCGVEGPQDYQTLGAQTPPTCICRDEGHRYGDQRRPPCSAQAHQLADGTVSAVWKTGCLQVKRDLIGYINRLRDMLIATVALQAAMMALGVVLGLNMPNSRSEDSDDEGGDY